LILANRKSIIIDDIELFNMDSSKGVGVQQVTCTGMKIKIELTKWKLFVFFSGGGQYSVWDFVSVFLGENFSD
jgi:hypothetical protein